MPDGVPAISLLDSIPAVPGPDGGRPRFRPDAFQGDRGYGWKRNIAAVRARGIRSELAPTQDPTHGSGLGKTRWVVEGGLSFFNHFRRLRLCYERSVAHLLGFHELAAALICHQRLLKWATS